MGGLPAHRPSAVGQPSVSAPAAVRPSERVLLSGVGLDLPKQLPFERWLEIGRQLSAVTSSAAWCLGDWLAQQLIGGVVDKRPGREPGERSRCHRIVKFRLVLDASSTDDYPPGCHLRELCLRPDRRMRRHYANANHAIQYTASEPGWERHGALAAPRRS
jgi:hypothetical protein